MYRELENDLIENDEPESSCKTNLTQVFKKWVFLVHVSNAENLTRAAIIATKTQRSAVTIDVTISKKGYLHLAVVLSSDRKDVSHDHKTTSRWLDEWEPNVESEISLHVLVNDYKKVPDWQNRIDDKKTQFAVVEIQSPNFNTS